MILYLKDCKINQHYLKYKMNIKIIISVLDYTVNGEIPGYFILIRYKRKIFIDKIPVGKMRFRQSL